MTVKLELSPEVQAGLLAQAQENGISLEAFAARVLWERVRGAMPAHSLSHEERLRHFDSWKNNHATTAVVLPDEAMERESIYGDFRL